ncbi:MAG: FAD:protein FMN transferase [Bacillota bacterium]
MAKKDMKSSLRLISLFMALALSASVSGCQLLNTRISKYTTPVHYTDSFFDTFDTIVTLVGYTKNKDEFDTYCKRVHTRMHELHRLYDIYNDYKGVNNIKTINDNAGVKPVKVNQEIIDLILFSKDWYQRTGGKVNIAMGAVLRIWHEYRQEGLDAPGSAKLPPMEALKEAAKHTDIDKVIVDTENSTVYLEDQEMRLDVGAVAKGYATEMVAQELIALGLESGMLSSGGNVRAIGKPLDGIRERWGVGIQNPGQSIVSEQHLLDVIYLNDASVASSGDYQRYYTVGGKRYHHIIDPETLMPAEYYRAVTVMTEHSGIADFMSTTLFLLPYEESRPLAESLDGVEALWVMPDGKVQATDGMKSIMMSQGATGSKTK